MKTFLENKYSKNRLIYDYAGDPLMNSLTSLTTGYTFKLCQNVSRKFVMINCSRCVVKLLGNVFCKVPRFQW